MKKSEAALLVTLPLGAPWYLWHGYPSIAAASMNAAFAVILGALIRGRRDAVRKLKTIPENLRCTRAASAPTSRTNFRALSS